MKTHDRFEFVIEETMESISGNSLEEIFNGLPKTIVDLGVTPKTKAKLCLEKFGIQEELPSPKDKDAFFNAFFNILQSHLIGTWKWYDSLIGDCWRFNPAINDLVRRKGRGRGKKKKYHMETSGANIRKSHEARRKNPELAARIASIAGKASIAKMTPEQIQERTRKMREARLRKLASMTPEEQAERKRKISEVMKAAYAKKKQKEQGESKCQK
jgi:hypothetical protein